MAVYKRGKTYWFRFVFEGRRIQRSTKQGDRDAAKDIEAAYRTQLGKKEVGLEEKPRYTIGGLLDKLRANYELRGKIVVKEEKVENGSQNLSLIKITKEEFGAKMADTLTADDYDTYVRRRQKEGAAIATINRVGQLLRSAYRLQSLPYPRFSIPKEQNARQGFFTPAEFQMLLNALPDDGLRDYVLFGYLTGMRKGEISSLRWEFVREGDIVLPGQYAKTGKPRTIPIEGEIAELIKRRESARAFKVCDVMHISPFIFHRGDGQKIKEFRKSWATACVATGLGSMACPKCGEPAREGERLRCSRCKRQRVYTGRIFHDLRRTSSRDMIRSGVPQSVAMSITGHTTISTFLRYNITSDEDKRNALRATAEYRAAQEKKVASISR